MTSIGGVDDVRALTDSEFAGLLDKLLSVQWPVPADRIRPLIERWGWPISWAAEDGSSYEADPGFGLATQALGSFDGFEGYLSAIVVGTSDYILDPTEASRAALRDAFALQVGVAQVRLGKPSRRKQGEVAGVAWDRPDGARLQVARSSESCWVEIASPEEAEVRRESGE
jgi:hypothetical protein